MIWRGAIPAPMSNQLINIIMEKYVIDADRERFLSKDAHPIWKKCLKGYDGEVVLLRLMKKDDFVMLPKIDAIIDHVHNGFAFMLFGCYDRSPRGKAVYREMKKFIDGKPYSIKNLAAAAELSNW